MEYRKEVVLYEKCSCILVSDVTSKECDKLFISLWHPELDEYYLFGICRNHIRSRLHDNRARRKKRYSTYDWYSKYEASNIIRDLANEEFGYDFNNYQALRSVGNENDLVNLRVIINTCKNPMMNVSYTIPEAIDILFSKKRGNYTLKDELVHIVTKYLENIKYKKYKTKYNKCLIELRKLKKDRVRQDELEAHWINIFAMILELRK